MPDPDPQAPLPAEALESIRGRSVVRRESHGSTRAQLDTEDLLVEVDRLRAQVRRLQAAEDVIERAWRKDYDPKIWDLAEALGWEETDE